jgi:octaprenyl-diphosphate synthase
MSKLDQIKAPIQKEMEIFEAKFKESMKSSAPLLDKITHYIVKRKGKQIRPMFVFLSAHVTGQVTETTFRAGILIELLHTATLVHDDVVDDSNERRGFFSLNAIWKNKIAVLVGDFLLSKGLLLTTQSGDYKLLEIVTNAVKLMSEGELLQIEKARRLDIVEEVYFEIIKRKTASLIASCCACGATSNGSSEETIKIMNDFGEKIGIAFQIKDDLFDYENSHLIGKPTGIDIKEQKMTLPLIYALNNTDKATKRSIIRIVKNNNNDPKKVAEVIEFVNQSGGLQYATGKMMTYKDEALAMLKAFPDSEYKTSLIDLVNFTVERNH